jgi:hypothetical protein
MTFFNFIKILIKNVNQASVFLIITLPTQEEFSFTVVYENLLVSFTVVF